MTVFVSTLNCDFDFPRVRFERWCALLLATVFLTCLTRAQNKKPATLSDVHHEARVTHCTKP